MGKILIVDDEPSILEVLQRYLRMKGFQTLQAQTGEEALQLFACEQVSAVLLDMHLNATQGLELLTQFLTVNPRLAVIMMSGAKDDEEVKAALALGADGYIQKPFDFFQLEALLRKTQEGGDRR